MVTRIFVLKNRFNSQFPVIYSLLDDHIFSDTKEKRASELTRRKKKLSKRLNTRQLNCLILFSPSSSVLWKKTNRSSNYSTIISTVPIYFHLHKLLSLAHYFSSVKHSRALRAHTRFTANFRSPEVVRHTRWNFDNASPDCDEKFDKCFNNWWSFILSLEFVEFC